MFNKSNFKYGDFYSDDYGVMLCNLNGADSRTLETENENEAITKSAYTDIWDFHGKEYSSPLSFELSICNIDGTYLSMDKIRLLKKMLCRNSRDLLEFETEEFSDIVFNCRFTNPKEELIGGRTMTLTFTISCDSPFGYSKEQSFIFTSSTTLSPLINVYSDFIDKSIYPKVTITMAAGNISIENTTTGEIIEIDDCVSTEIIELNCANMFVETSDARNIISAWNKSVISMVDGVNELNLTGDFTVEIKYRTPVRIGV